jgi:hypothetical protein
MEQRSQELQLEIEAQALTLAESRFALAALERLPADPAQADALRKLLRHARPDDASADRLGAAPGPLFRTPAHGRCWRAGPDSPPAVSPTPTQQAPAERRAQSTEGEADPTIRPRRVHRG